MTKLWKLILVGVLLAVIAVGISGCALLNPEVQSKLDVLADKHKGLVERIDEIKTKIAEGTLSASEGIAAISIVTAEAKEIFREIKDIQAESGVPAWQVGLAGLANLLLLAFGGKEYLAGKNALLTIVRLIDKARKGHKNVEQLKGMIAHKNNPVINKAAEALPPMT